MVNGWQTAEHNAAPYQIKLTSRAFEEGNYEAHKKQIQALTRKDKGKKVKKEAVANAANDKGKGSPG